MKNLSGLLKILSLALIMLSAVLCSIKDRPYCIDFRDTVLDRGAYCGHKRTKTSYIMNGRDADLGEFPWMARLYYRGSEKDDKQILPECGGSIIHERWILSAAHCCNNRLSYVRLGEHNSRSKIDCQNGLCAPPYVNIWVDYHVSHEEYNPITFDNDICLVHLKKQIKFNDYVQPICLPIYCEIQTTKFRRARFTVAGWGALDEENQTYPETLQKTDLPIVSRHKCQKMWASTGDITQDQICAGMEDRRDSCMGDSGGPLMYRAALYGPVRYFQVGIVSFGSDCNLNDSRNLPGVYLRVSSYLSWIEGIIEHNKENK